MKLPFVPEKPPAQGYLDTLLLLLIAVCMSLLVYSNGNVLLALAPLGLGGVGLALWRMPMRYMAHMVLFAGLLVDNPTERPGRNLYRTPLLPLGNLLYESLSKTLHVPGLKLSGLELLIVMLSLIIAVRMSMGHPVDAPADGSARHQAAAPLMQACVVSMLALLLLEIYGLARGGSLPHSLLQMQTMFFMPFMTMFFAYAWKRRSDIRILLNSLLLVGVARALQCFYYWATVIRHNAENAGGESGDGSYVTTHSDSILAAVVVVICIVSVYEKPNLQHICLAACVLPVVGAGIVLNNRRIAFVAVGLGLLCSYMAAPLHFRRRVHQTLMLMTPLLLLYMAAGWQASGGWAKPVQSLKSVFSQHDTSSATRDIENYNLLATLRQNPLIGSGFGHAYLEKIKAFDISKIFEAYRYVPHNSILWFWGVGGVIGFTAYWMFVVIGVFMAARLCLVAETHRQVVMGMTALSAVASWASQCFGDMGLMSWMGSLIVAASLGICSSMCNARHSWSATPSHFPPLKRQRLAAPSVLAPLPRQTTTASSAWGRWLASPAKRARLDPL